MSGTRNHDAHDYAERIRERLPRRLQEIREAAGFTKYGLARESGVSREYIGKIERGKANPTLPAVQNNSGTLSITWTKAPGHLGTCGTDFVIETSDTLSGVWTTETLGVNVSANGNNFTYTFPAGTRRFARLKVMGP